MYDMKGGRMMTLEVKQLEKKYGDNPVLQGISFKVNSGKAFPFLRE